MSDDEEDDDFRRLFDNGEWKWDDLFEGLVFVSNLKPEEIDVTTAGPVAGGAIEFREDMDVLEQVRTSPHLNNLYWSTARRRPPPDKRLVGFHLMGGKLFSRRFLPDDVILLQDVKDLMLYSAPKALLTPVLINVFHRPLVDRMLRALLLYCQYFIQITDTMNKRMAELSEKVRTDECQSIETEYRENLEDLRLIVAKEYSNALLGCEGMSKYHHMGPSKKMRSLTKFDAILFETLVRFSIQFVWLALGRKSFNLIELEVHRLFKSSIFNIAEHNLHMDFESEMNETTANVLFGNCVLHKRKLNTNSPLSNALDCTSRKIDYRLLGLGSIKFHGLDDRQLFFVNALTLHESEFEFKRMSMGILGLKRTRFDTMLREVKGGGSTTSSATSIKQSSAKEVLEDVFPDELLPRANNNEGQKKRWLSYILRIRNSKKKRSTVSNKSFDLNL